MQSQIVDRLDRKILEIVQVNTHTSSESIGSRVGLSASAVQRRLKKLRAEKIIEADVAVLSPIKFGYSMTFIVNVTLVCKRPDLTRAFESLMKNIQHVQQCYHTTGDADFVLIVTFDTIDSYQEFADTLLKENYNIENIKTNVVSKRIKTSLSLPIYVDTTVRLKLR